MALATIVGTTHRLSEVGLTLGKTIEVLRQSHTMIVRVDGCVYCVRDEELKLEETDAA